jgi:hypothetical protein
VEFKKIESLLGIFTFNSGVAWPSNEAVSDEKVLKILRANMLVESCELYAEHHVHVRLKRALGIKEIKDLRILLRGQGVEFLQRKTQACSRLLEPVQQLTHV